MKRRKCVPRLKGSGPKGPPVAGLLSLLLALLVLAPCLRADRPQAATRVQETGNDRLKGAYLKKVGHMGGVTVWTVNGMYVRTNLDEEFTNFGHHYSFSFIPPNEFWLDREAVPNERDFYIHHMVKEYGLMARGVPYDSALDAADSLEARERLSAGDRNKVLTRSGAIDTSRVHRKLWKKLASGLRVWIVDGRLVRSVFFTDFTEGGHDRVYPFVPRGEVWIDDDLLNEERPFVLLHELHERALMATGLTYDAAHERSSLLESSCRRHPEELPGALRREGWK